MVYNPRGRVLPHQLLQYLPLTTLPKSSLQRRARASPTLKYQKTNKGTAHAQKKKKKKRKDRSQKIDAGGLEKLKINFGLIIYMQIEHNRYTSVFVLKMLPKY